MAFHDLARYQHVGAQSPVQRFFLGSPTTTDLPLAAKIGAPLVPLGLGGIALGYFLKKPSYGAMGLLASVLGVSLLSLRTYYADKELASRGIT